MTKGRGVLLVVAAMVFLTVGFVVGQMVQAAGTIPGSSSDPLVAQSYVEEIVGKKVAGLQTKIDELQANVDSLKDKVDSLEAGGNNTSQAQEPSKQTTSTTEPSVSNNSSSDGKTVSITGKLANIRSGPGTTYDKVTTLYAGDSVAYLDKENGWIKVLLGDGQEGWVAEWLAAVK